VEVRSSLVFVDPADIEPGSVVAVRLVWTPRSGVGGWADFEAPPDPPADLFVGWWSVASVMGAAWGDHHPARLSKVMVGIALLFQEVPGALSVSVRGETWTIPFGLHQTVGLVVKPSLQADHPEMEVPDWLRRIPRSQIPEAPSVPALLWSGDPQIPEANIDMLPDPVALYNMLDADEGEEKSMECGAVSQEGRACVLEGPHPTHRSDWPIVFWENASWKEPTRRGVSRLDSLLDRLSGTAITEDDQLSPTQGEG